MEDIFELVDSARYDEFVALARQSQLIDDDYYDLIRRVHRIYAENENVDDPMPEYYPFVQYIVPHLTVEQKNRYLVEFCSMFAPEIVRILIENGADPHYKDDEPYKTSVSNDNVETKRMLEERYGCHE
jgi:hypothetical protein